MFDRKAILEDWVQRLARSRLLMGDRAVVTGELDGWLALLADGEGGAEADLQRLLALHGRELGLTGRPASAAIGQLLALDEALEHCGAEAARAAIPSMLRIVSDGHNLGHAARLRASFAAQIRDFSPVVQIRPGTVVGFLLGPMDGDNLDALFGRVARSCAAQGAGHAVVDVRGADPVDDRFHRTVHGLLTSRAGRKITLTVCGLDDPSATQVAIEALGVNPEQLRCVPALDEALAEA